MLRLIARIPDRCMLFGTLLAAACGGGGSSTGPTPPVPPPPPPPPPSQSMVRLTVVLPAITDGPINQTAHRVHIISGTSGVTSGGSAGTPLNRASVTLKGFSCSRMGPQATTCDVDIPIGQAVALVVEEGRSFHGGLGQTGGTPPDDWPAEFVDWGGDFSTGEIVEPGFLRFTADRNRRIEARFRTIFPMTLNMNVQGIGGIAFKVTIPPTPLLSLPPSTLQENGQQTVSWGGQGSQAVEWFFLRTGSSATLEAIDDIDRGCMPTPSIPCSEFQSWSGACTGSGICTLVPKPVFQNVIANGITRTN